jgi:hypothetical protein
VPRLCSASRSDLRIRIKFGALKFDMAHFDFWRNAEHSQRDARAPDSIELPAEMLICLLGNDLELEEENVAVGRKRQGKGRLGS